ncbi:MAG: flagellar biosynthesis protein FlhB [Actinomycetota bacterium]|nr:flagellar biosynthesis protein FlhB [Actinomycetota bacterium]
MAKNNEKTEKPTPKRLKKARSEGQIAKSPELFSWLSLLVATLVLPSMFSGMAAKIDSLMYLIPQATANLNASTDLQMLSTGFGDFVSIVGPIAIAVTVAAIAISLAQTGFGLFYKSVTPDFKKINPFKGVKRIFSPNGLVEALKSIFKIALIGGLGYTQTRSLSNLLSTNTNIDLGTIISETSSIILGATRVIALAGLALAVFDYARQRRELMNSLKMSHQDIKDEHKEDQGDPAIKGRIRRMQIQLSRSRMMARIEEATVVVVNPTHFAVAILYDPKVATAPKVVAKGKDYVAFAIKERAQNAKVPIVRDAPLARALYISTNLEEQIPFALYRAVAKLIAYVYRLSAFARSQETTHHTAKNEIPSELLAKAAALK